MGSDQLDELANGPILAYKFKGMPHFPLERQAHPHAQTLPSLRHNSSFLREAGGEGTLEANHEQP